MINQKKKILICGVTGFIGRNIAEALAKQSCCIVKGIFFKSNPFKNSDIEFIKADLTDKNDVQKVIKDVDIIIQAAATTSGSKDIIQKPYLHVTDNAVMNSLIFRQAYEQSIKHVVFFSCSVMYQPAENPLKETDFNANLQIFPNYFGVGWTKVYIEKMCEFYSRIGNTKYTVIRHSNIYGPWDKYDLERSHVFGATVTKVMTAQENGNIVVWGNGEEGRDLLYIDDLVSFVKKSIDIQDKPYALYNAGSGKIVKIKDLVHKIIEASGKNLNIVFDSTKPSINTTICLDYGKAKKELSWVPQVSLDEGIKKTLQWYIKNYQNKV